jgi:hypothetical protein
VSRGTYERKRICDRQDDVLLTRTANMKDRPERDGFSVVAVRSEEKSGRLFVRNRKAV